MQHGVTERQRRRVLEEPHPGWQQHRQRIDDSVLDTRGSAAPAPSAPPAPTRSGVAAASEERAQIADARACEPGERITRAAGVRSGRPEPEPAVAERIEVRIDFKAWHPSRLIIERPFALGQPPAAPLQVRNRGVDPDGHRIERAHQRQPHLRRAIELGFTGRGHDARTGEPGHQGIEHAETVGREVEHQCAVIRPAPAQRAAAAREQSRLLHSQRVHEQLSIRETDARRACVDDGSREE